MNATASSPTTLAASIPARRKLLPLVFCAILFDCTVEDVLKLVEDGTAGPAFNIASRPEGQREIRVFRGAVENGRPGQRPAKVDLGAVIADILPPLGLTPAAKATARSVDLAFRFCVNHKSTLRLIRANELSQVGAVSRGQGASPRVSYISAARFLERRVL